MVRVPVTCLFSIALLAGCGAGETVGELLPGASKVGREVVSTVDGTPISVADVQRVVRETGWSPKKALRKLQARRLLAREAERRGYAADPEVAAHLRRATVQALLAGKIEAEEADEEALRRAYEESGRRFRHGELRTGIHVLAEVKEDTPPEVVRDARIFIERVLARFGEADDPDEVLDWAARYYRSQQPAFKIRAEKLPPTERDGRFVEPFETPYFAAEGPGPLSEVIHTDFGFHAVVLAEITPPKHIPFEEAREELLPGVLQASRREAAQDLVERLHIATRIHVDDAAAAQIGELSL